MEVASAVDGMVMERGWVNAADRLFEIDRCLRVEGWSWERCVTAMIDRPGWEVARYLLCDAANAMANRNWTQEINVGRGRPMPVYSSVTQMSREWAGDPAPVIASLARRMWLRALGKVEKARIDQAVIEAGF